METRRTWCSSVVIECGVGARSARILLFNLLSIMSLFSVSLMSLTSQLYHSLHITRKALEHRHSNSYSRLLTNARTQVRDSYNYIRFFPNGQMHFLIHYLAPERAIPLMMDQALNIHRNDEVSSKLQFYTGSYFFRPRKRNIEIHMFQGRYLVRILLNDVQQECFGRFESDIGSMAGSTSSSGESDCSVATSSTLNSLKVEVHDAVIMHKGKPEGPKLVFNLYDPSKNYNFVPFTL